MRHWNEIRTVAKVAKLGTIAGAADSLGLHRATVARHIDTLEGYFGSTLFLRHAKGMSPTSLGLELLEKADFSETQFLSLKKLASASNGSLEGTLTLTFLDDLSYLALPALTELKKTAPQLNVSAHICDQPMKLEYGEADVALRMGSRPSYPDYVVSRIAMFDVGLFSKQGFEWPENSADLPDKIFVAASNSVPASSWGDWLRAAVPARTIGMRCNSYPVLWKAVLCGLGVGFVPRHLAVGQGMTEVLEPCRSWAEPIWLVTHVDLHRTAKVQAFTSALKSVVGQQAQPPS